MIGLCSTYGIYYKLSNSLNVFIHEIISVLIWHMAKINFHFTGESMEGCRTLELDFGIRLKQEVCSSYDNDTKIPFNSKCHLCPSCFVGVHHIWFSGQKKCFSYILVVSEPRASVQKTLMWTHHQHG